MKTICTIAFSFGWGAARWSVIMIRAVAHCNYLPLYRNKHWHFTLVARIAYNTRWVLAIINNGLYIHDVVNHSLNFVDPVDDNIYTQSVENFWMREMQKLKRQCGISEDLFSTYLIYIFGVCCLCLQAVPPVNK